MDLRISSRCLAALALCVGACSEDAGSARHADAGADAGAGAQGGAGGSGAGGDASVTSGGSGGASVSTGGMDSGGGPRVDSTDGGDGGEDAAVADASADAAADAPSEAGDAGASYPPYPPVAYPAGNAPSDAKALLGKILFWDEQLSSDGTVACGTCHRSASGGSDPRASDALSRHPGPDGVIGTTDDIHGARGIARCQIVSGAVSYVGDAVFGTNAQVTRRKPPSYFDAMFFPELFWDGRAKGAFTDPDTKTVLLASGAALESQAVGPPMSDAEMACEARVWSDVHDKLRTATPLALASNVPADLAAFIAGHGASYPALFSAAFGTDAKVSAADPDDVINTRRIAFAIATHERRLTSDRTPWDRWNAGDRAALTPAQVHGFEVFMGKGRCNVCHAPPLFADLSFHNLGFVSATFDTGREETTSVAADRGAFETPTLRNVALREAGGLLHTGSGSGATLEAVVAAYNVPPNLDPNVDPEIRVLGLTGTEAKDLVDFMRNGLTDPRVLAESPPFDRPDLGHP